MRVSCTFVTMAVLLVLQSQCSPINVATTDSEVLDSLPLLAGPVESNNLLNLHLPNTHAVKDLKLAPTTDDAVSPLIGHAALTPLLSDVTGLGILAKRSPEPLLPFGGMSGLTHALPVDSALSSLPVPSIGNVAKLSNAVPGIGSLAGTSGGLLGKRGIIPSVAPGVPDLGMITGAFPSFDLSGLTGGLMGKRDITSGLSHLGLSSALKPVTDLLHKREVGLPMNGLGSFGQLIPMGGMSPLGGSMSSLPGLSQLGSLPFASGLASSLPLGKTF